MEWLLDPTAWLGFVMLVGLGTALGIDERASTATLVDPLPPAQRARARVLGPVLALLMGLGLLASLAWLAGVIAPRVRAFSERELILLFGGVLLLCRATLGLHARLEERGPAGAGRRASAGLQTVVAQIVVFDALFALDAVIIAVGISGEPTLMMAAVAFALMLVLFAGKPLAAFVDARPTVVILCRGLQLMIGFSLVAEGFGFPIPKGCLYAAIGVPALVEACAQLARARRRAAATTDARETPAFAGAERAMIASVLGLAERPLRAIMTPRCEVARVDLADDEAAQRTALTATPHARLVLVREGTIDEPLGVIEKKDLFARLARGEALDLAAAARPPLFLPEVMPVLGALEQFRQSGARIAFVVDEFGGFEGVVTLTDVIQAIAGTLPDEYELDSAPDGVREDAEGWLIGGRVPLEQLRARFGLALAVDGDYHTAAGLVLGILERLPSEGDRIELGDGWVLEVAAVAGHRIERLRLRRTAASGDGAVVA